MKIILINLLLLIPVLSMGQNIPAFPGAEGAGKYTTGGRGGFVYTVTNLNDDGPGSLRDGIQKKGARIIVFAVNGNIDLKTQLVINNNDITIAGQSAPGLGICLKGNGMRINANNVIVRYLRIRPGDELKIELDALTAKYNKNIIIDHCSFSWATDEVCSIYDNENATLQWCIISESLNSSVHSKGEHGYGGIWGGMKTTFHHNLLAHHKSRNPRLQGSRKTSTPETERAEIVNNIIYNWKTKCMYAGEKGNYTIVGNYFKAGPATTKSASKRLIQPYDPYGNFVFAQNMLFNQEDVTNDNRLGIQMDKDSMAVYFKKYLPAVSCYKPEPAIDAYEKILKYAGANKCRDNTDKRIIQEVKDGIVHSTLSGIINSQRDVGGWDDIPAAYAPKDSDKDGMPDSWEKENGLDPNNRSDASEYKLDATYTNIEFYVNTLL